VTAHWLLKSEPGAYSFAQMTADKKTDWTGVRNHLAAKHLKAMQVGDLCFFYHSNVGKEIVGVVRVTKTFSVDPKDPPFGMVEVAFDKALPSPVTLAAIKNHPALKDMVFVKQSRLSVSPVTAAEWRAVLALSAKK
jgi:predicted RNA-binding protein with PUA-like domain